MNRKRVGIVMGLMAALALFLTVSVATSDEDRVFIFPPESANREQARKAVDRIDDAMILRGLDGALDPANHGVVGFNTDAG